MTWFDPEGNDARICGGKGYAQRYTNRKECGAATLGGEPAFWQASQSSPRKPARKRACRQDCRPHEPAYVTGAWDHLTTALDHGLLPGTTINGSSFTKIGSSIRPSFTTRTTTRTSAGFSSNAASGCATNI